MHPKRKKRLFYIIILVMAFAAATLLVLYALRQNINLYLTPAQVTERQSLQQTEFRLGGYVVKGSVKHLANSLTVYFVLTDFKKKMRVEYTGILPALFREGQGIVAQGHLRSRDEFIADQVLAKHDEKYKPPELPAQNN